MSHLDDPTPPDGIGATSLGVALLRARESRRDDRLFDDPYALRFVERADIEHSMWARARPAVGPDFHDLMAEQVAVRTRFLDEVLLDAARSGVTQIVLLASGMDTRAFRLDWPAGTTVVEVDLPEVLAFKNAVLDEQAATPRCHRVEVRVDLAGDWPAALSRAGFRPDRPAAWLAEGILYALPPEAAGSFLDRITASSAAGSVLAFDHMQRSELLHAARAAVSPELTELWRGGPTADLGDWLRGRGWRPEVHDINDVAAGYHRPALAAFAPSDDRAGQGWLVTAHHP